MSTSNSSGKNSPSKESIMKNETEKQTTKHDSASGSGSPATPPLAPRRQLLGSGAYGAAAVVFGIAAAACGDDEDAGDGASGGSSGKGGAGSGGAAGKGGTAGKGGSGAMAGEGGEGGVGNAPDADIASLNALLSAEYNAITAYTAGAGLIGAAESDDPLYDLRGVIVDIAVSIQSQHKLHAEALVDAIEELDGTPVAEAAVAASFTPPAALLASPTITNVLKFAASAERGAAVAYNQVLAGLESAQLRFLATSIEGDETQHFIVLAALVLGLASPGPNLSSETAEEVIPQAFVSSVGSVKGLESAPPDYFA